MVLSGMTVQIPSRKVRMCAFVHHHHDVTNQAQEGKITILHLIKSSSEESECHKIIAVRHPGLFPAWYVSHFSSKAMLIKVFYRRAKVIIFLNRL